MKKLITLKPGFELIFALSIMAIFVLPAVVCGQGKYNKKMSIIIQNGDTTVNGKKLKDLSPEERKEALGVFDQDNSRPHWRRSGRDNAFGFRGDSAQNYQFKIDTNGTMLTDRSGRLPEMMRRMMPDMQNFGAPRWEMRTPGGSEMNDRRSPRRNRLDVQEFNFSNTDKNGVYTSISFRVGRANPEDTKRIAKTEKNDLELDDLTLTPEFTSGKTLLNFSLTEKAPAEVTFTNDEGKPLWTAKANSSFTKSFMMPTNGYYYLVVKQGGKVAVKRVVKE
ncbi:putative secreted protein (Por secretion system target) [Mucilaginibacter yixingensis]|uniref:Putative secreted protein (Por secretion system target) n=1 Tax=Mucilaginibacter yixingensis TaxID=1295612 RepID=A0A2T5J869_9SPHI|nr:T9SS type A sorting domain-containing protein [Mucilaginibacter yixingensis]PTQ95658.1 putative secreted protein (Por secretion system target) [Mucilaginibacter yixingensis]